MTARQQKIKDLRILQDFFFRHSGLGFPFYSTKKKTSWFELFLKVRSQELGLLPSRYLEQLRQEPTPQRIKKENSAFLRTLGLHKTFFFREPSHFSFLVRHVLPNLQFSTASVQILSAPCSTGEEPYSIVASISEQKSLKNIKLCVTALDLSTEAIRVAQQAVYQRAKNYPALTRPRSRSLFIRPTIQSRVKFEVANLLKVSLPKVHYDVIFCRNFLYYLREPDRALITDRFTDALKPGGYLFFSRFDPFFKNARLRYIKWGIFKKI